MPVLMPTAAIRIRSSGLLCPASNQLSCVIGSASGVQVYAAHSRPKIVFIPSSRSESLRRTAVTGWLLHLEPLFWEQR